MREVFLSQLDRSFSEREELFHSLENKSYYDGTPIRLGDNILFALLNDGINYSIITLKDSQLDRFQLDTQCSSFFPVLNPVDVNNVIAPNINSKRTKA